MSVACLSVEQILAHIVDWKLFPILLLDKHGTHGNLRDCKVNVKLFPILGFRKER